MWGGNISLEILRRKPTPTPQNGISYYTKQSETPFKLEDHTDKASLCYLGRPCLTNEARYDGSVGTFGLTWGPDFDL